MAMVMASDYAKSEFRQHLCQYFLDYASVDWNAEHYRGYFNDGRVRFGIPKTGGNPELQSWHSNLLCISQQQSPFCNLPQDDVDAATALLQASKVRRIQSSKRSNPQSEPTIVFNHVTQSNFNFKGPPPKEQPHPKRQRTDQDSTHKHTPTTVTTETQGSTAQAQDSSVQLPSEVQPPKEVEPPKGVQSLRADAVKFVVENPGLENDLLLPSGQKLFGFLKELAGGKPVNGAITLDDVLQGRLIIKGTTDTPLERIFTPEDYKYLQKNFPRLPATPEAFDGYLALFKDFLEDGDLRKLPACPEYLDLPDQGLFGYISDALKYYRTHWQTLLHRGPSHGEVWHNIHVWGPLLDRAFLYSTTVTLDRKELQSQVSMMSTQVYSNAQKKSYDGIFRFIRHVTKDHKCNVDIGFCEDKPPRAPYPADSKEDRKKVISAMESAILQLWKTGVSASVMREVLTIGLICNGSCMTLILGSTLIPGVNTFKEGSFDWSLESIPKLATLFWRLKLSAEKTFQLLGEFHDDSLSDF